MKSFSILPIACSSILFATCNSTANHNSIVNEESLKTSGIEHAIYKELQHVVAHGIKMHFEYDFKDVSQMKQCYTDNKLSSQRNEKILLKINNLRDSKKKSSLQMLTQDALKCGECGSSLYSCSQAAMSINKQHHDKPDRFRGDI